MFLPNLRGSLSNEACFYCSITRTVDISGWAMKALVPGFGGTNFARGIRAACVRQCRLFERVINV
jgi:hypothetical protein